MIGNEVIERRLRTFLLGLAAVALITTLIELWLQDHYHDFTQLIPIILGGVGLLTVAVAFFRANHLTLIAVRAVMSIVALGGVIGIWIHLAANFTFQQEIRPTATLSDYWLEVIKGAAPLLAPGALIFAALLAIIATYRHPTLAQVPVQTSQQPIAVER
jgi:MFS family permease